MASQGMPRRALAILVGISAIPLVLGAYFAVRAQAQEGLGEPAVAEPASPPEPSPPPPPESIQFPIAELGDCGSATACERYCDDLSHKDACVAFGLAHGLIDQEEAEVAENIPSTGPGGCSTESSCRAYCEDPAHLAECTAFAAAHEVISEEDARKAEILLTTGGPGGCRTPDECRAYCADPAHEPECFEFAKTNGFISEAEVERIEKLREEAAVSAEEPGPGGCTSETTCRAYCADPDRITECLAFAESKGFISPEDAERIRKSGFTAGPGGCKGEAECRAYCEDPGHQAACIDFAVQNGFMTEEEARLARKFAGKTGPGGCKGEQCREYCESPDHAEVCLDFAAAEGLMSPEELARARKFMRIAQEGGPGGCTGIQCKTYCQDPAHQDDCFAFAEKHDLIPPEAKKDYEVGKKIRQKMAESGGPGGCRTDDECRAYCADPGHVEECVAFGAAHGGIPPEEVRRMLKEFSEGRFEAHGDFGPPEDFRRFEEEARRRFEEFRQLEVEFRGGPPAGFPGAPGAFPGAPGAFPGGPPGGPGFVGPGGCTSPSECIAYCKEHREECFSFGPPGAPSVRPPEGGLPPGFEVPELRRDLLQRASGETRTVAGATLALTKQSGGFYRLVVRASRGVQEFSLGLAGGSNYGGGINGCPREFVNENASFKDSDFPFTRVTVTDCDGTTHPVALPPPFGAGGAPGVIPPGFQPLPGFQPPPPGFPPPPAGALPERCPLMPTVDSCPTGQRREVAFSSPECGTYYTCVPEAGLPGGETGITPPSSLFPAEDPARRCAGEGGSWDGTTCTFPSGSPSSFLIQHGAASLLRGLWGLLGF